MNYFLYHHGNKSGATMVPGHHKPHISWVFWCFTLNMDVTFDGLPTEPNR